MSDRWPVSENAEIVVVGSGPAGAAAAATLARNGRDVVLIDENEFPRDKPCGDVLGRAAIAAMRELGLEEITDGAIPLESVCIEYAHREVWERSMSPMDGRLSPRCMPRRVLDEALFNAALSSGARFIRARVDDIVIVDGRVSAVTLSDGNGASAKVRAKQFIAADGAASQIRSRTFTDTSTSRVSASAARQYFRTENPIERCLWLQVPLRLEDEKLPGYSWITPVGEQRVNLGVLLHEHRAPSQNGRVSVREILARLLAERRSSPFAKLGDLEPESEVRGASIGVEFSAHEARYENLLFVGDAARLADSLTGHGVSAALRSGIMAAQSVNGSLRRGDGGGYGDRLHKRFPRVGQDVAVLIREYDRLLAETLPAASDSGDDRSGHPLLRDIADSMGNGDDLEFQNTPVALRMAELHDDLPQVFAALDSLAFETLDTEFPFAQDMFRRRICAAAGPTAAILLISDVVSPSVRSILNVVHRQNETTNGGNRWRASDTRPSRSSPNFEKPRSSRARV